ncbi:hypothetical protein PC116_g27391 [Phytophthora cactorum]|nr:hypothetical protein Pcac1_g6639 [Phytophthora cactorum]KAG4224149.1 hypothetical protein PC116_g27391 [Phytophthora cactorum]
MFDVGGMEASNSYEGCRSSSRRFSWIRLTKEALASASSSSVALS